MVFLLCFPPQIHPPTAGAAREIQPLADVARGRSQARLSGRFGEGIVKAPGVNNYTESRGREVGERRGSAIRVVISMLEFWRNAEETAPKESSQRDRGRLASWRSNALHCFFLFCIMCCRCLDQHPPLDHREQVARKNVFLRFFVHLSCPPPLHMYLWQRLQDMMPRVNTLPLGCGALAGHAFSIDREFLREKLGFDSVSLNSMV